MAHMTDIPIYGDGAQEGRGRDTGSFDGRESFVQPIQPAFYRSNSIAYVFLDIVCSMFVG